MATKQIMTVVFALQLRLEF